MKHLFFILVVIVMGSCAKTKTCTCKDSWGTVNRTYQMKTNSKAKLQKFEEDCKKDGTITTVTTPTGSSTTTTPCEIS